MARLIDADKLFPHGAVPYITDDGFRTADKIYGIIKKAPTVDAVEVIRCKDCKHLYDGMDDYCCTLHMGLVRICENSFCSYGERRTE